MLTFTSADVSARKLRLHLFPRVPIEQKLVDYGGGTTPGSSVITERLLKEAGRFLTRIASHLISFHLPDESGPKG